MELGADLSLALCALKSWLAIRSAFICFFFFFFWREFQPMTFASDDSFFIIRPKGVGRD